jgi:ribosomal protein L10
LETAVEENKVEIARNLVSLGSNNDFIAKATGLTVEQIEALRSEKM